MKRTAILSALVLIGHAAVAQTKAPLPPLPAPQFIPKPAADTGQPYAPQSILPGGIVVPLYPPSSPYLKADKIQEKQRSLRSVRRHLVAAGLHREYLPRPVNNRGQVEFLVHSAEVADRFAPLLCPGSG